MLGSKKTKWHEHDSQNMVMLHSLLVNLETIITNKHLVVYIICLPFYSLSSCVLHYFIVDVMFVCLSFYLYPNRLCISD